MKKYIALLRGMNVSGHKKIKMAELKELLKEIGFDDVQTYIQSGNVIFNAEPSKNSVLAEKIKVAIKRKFDFDVPVLVKNREELQEIFDSNPIDEKVDIKNQYFILLGQNPAEEKINALNPSDYLPEEFFITPSCVYLNCSNGYGNTKCNNNFFEQKLKVEATTRNYKTLANLLELSSK
tara:strand:+ start:1926 stop:2462 length:537 start_codon:yes stop_codon:yes gene_type:complete